MVEANSSVHPSTCQGSHYFCKPETQPGFGEDYPLSIPMLPKEHHLGFGGGLRTRSSSSAETRAGSHLEDRNLMRWFSVPMNDCH